jgi:hypothetical protein
MTQALQGLDFIHSSALGFHGSLTSMTCYVDSHWALKLSCYDAGVLRLETTEAPDIWSAPERLRDSERSNGASADVYSYGVIMQEILYDAAPFFTEAHGIPGTHACSDQMEHALTGDNINCRGGGGHQERCIASSEVAATR